MTPANAPPPHAIAAGRTAAILIVAQSSLSAAREMAAEYGGKLAPESHALATKRRLDPAALLNPGKARGVAAARVPCEPVQAATT